jgi:hypothetical protein
MTVIIPRITLDGEDAAWLAQTAAETGVTLRQLVESLLALIVADERAIQQSKGDAA